jgi:hypothetical protein
MARHATRWTSQFFATLQEDRGVADELRRASLDAELARWTALLTTAVVQSYEQLGWQAAGKGHRCHALPVGRNEYLSQDVMAFPSSPARWRFPIAVCELENSASLNQVAYSLWKVLCVRCGLRTVFCYRSDAADGPTLVAALGDVVDGMPISERVDMEGETLVVVGSRNDSQTFPYGFFQMWKLNSNTGRFERFARR